MLRNLSRSCAIGVVSRRQSLSEASRGSFPKVRKLGEWPVEWWGVALYAQRAVSNASEKGIKVWLIKRRCVLIVLWKDSMNAFPSG